MNTKRPCTKRSATCRGQFAVGKRQAASPPAEAPIDVAQRPNVLERAPAARAGGLRRTACMRSGPSRRGVTLLELVIASSMLAVIATSLSLVLRTARTAWEVNDRDYGAMHHAHTVARHFVRQAREATAVTSLPSGAKTISLRLRDGTDLSWSHAASLGGRNNVVVVTFPGSGDQIPLAYDISNLSFTGYKADGLTKTTNVDDVRLVEIAVTVTLPNNSSTQQTVVSKVWIRAW